MTRRQRKLLAQKKLQAECRGRRRYGHEWKLYGTAGHERELLKGARGAKISTLPHAIKRHRSRILISGKRTILLPW